MIGSVERFRRHFQARHFAPMMLLVIGIPARPDPIAKRTPTSGTSAGLIPIPGANANAPAGRADLMAEARRDMRADRGRILYGAGHAPRDTAVTSGRTLPKHYCPEQRVVQGHGTPAPNS